MRGLSRLRGAMRTAWLACLLALPLVACGIDETDDEEGTPKPAPDITGIWQGEFVSAEDGAVTQITRLTFVKSAEDTYLVDFDIEFTVTGYFLWFWTNREAWRGTINPDGSMFMESGDGALAMSAQIKSPTFIKGNYLLRFPVEDDGTWEVTKIGELDP